MAEALTEEIRKYTQVIRQLKDLLEDTQRVFKDVNAAKCFIGVHSITGELSEKDEREIETVSSQPPCFVVYGDTVGAKSAVINRLFQRELLPSSPSPTCRWKTIRFTHSPKTRVVQKNVDYVAAKKPKSLVSFPLGEIHIEESNCLDKTEGVATGGPPDSLDVQLNDLLLAAGARVTLAGSGGGAWSDEEVFNFCTEGLFPIIIYAVSSTSFNEQEIRWLKFIRSKAHDLSVFFVRVASNTSPFNCTPFSSLGGIEILATNKHPPPPTDQLSSPSTDGQRYSALHSVESLESKESSPVDHSLIRQTSSPSFYNDGSLVLLEQLVNLGFECNVRANDDEPTGRISSSSLDAESDSYSAESELLESIEQFKSFTLYVHSVLHRRLAPVVTRINVAHSRCLETMIALAHDMKRDVMITPKRISFAREKEDELYTTLMDMTHTKQEEINRLILETIDTEKHKLINIAVEYQFVGISIPYSEVLTSAKDLKQCTSQIQELVLSHLNQMIAGKLACSIDVLRESCTGVLMRALQSLEQKDTDQGESIETSKALSEILNAAYTVDINVGTGASFVKTVIEKMKQLMQAVLWRSKPRVNAEWKRKVASNMLAALSDARCQRLARSICAQIQERLERSHQNFGSALRQLQLRHSDRLEKTLVQRETVAKDYAPRVARLSLESRSLKDLIAHGSPRRGQEIGRGQYGIVLSCDSWGGFSPCAIKSVLPPDERHWNDLAMEFYYYKNVPEHERIVALRGSIIEYTMNGAGDPVALLIMDRLKWDFHAAIKKNLCWISRLQVSIDVVEGIRFLHSRGLVHRDVKLQNVLLDDKDRGKLTDLGFCKPEAMMSGSLVGSPIHMAPELFSGSYDHTVDLYAFGILFWYACAGTVSLPRAFEKCPSKEMLWMLVKAGLRPEEPPNCDADCWRLMTSCWEDKADQRPYVGTVEITLRSILARYTLSSPATVAVSPVSSSHTQSIDSDSDVD